MNENKNTDYETILKSVRLLASGEQPITDITDLLFRHGCFYLLSQMKLCEAHAYQQKTNAAMNRICINERYRQCHPVFHYLETANIPYAVIKGAILSASAFQDPYIRHSGDIDLLIAPQNIDTVKRIMLSNGFIQGRVTENGIHPFTRRELLFQSTTSHQTAPFVKETRNKLCPYINVDINMNLLWGESKQKLDMAFVLEHTIQTDICGIQVRKLLPEMEFISLCLHHYKDMNSIFLLSHGSLKLTLFCDIYYYVKNNPLDASLLYALCNRLHVSEYVYYCLYFTDFIFHDSLLKDYCHGLHSPIAEANLDYFGLADNERQKWRIPFPERLLDTDIPKVFQETLSHELLDKIRTNEEYM